MSWIKKLFHMFKDNDEEYEEFEDHADERNQEKQPASQSTKESSRDVDAKVVYQYPKGQFRFPVIPDHEAARENKRQQKKEHTRGQTVKETSEKRQPRVRETERKRKPADSPFHEKRVPRSAERERQKKTAPSPASEEKILTRNERDAANKKRPFQPTEIPSPIYGFKRPGSKTPKEQSGSGEQENSRREITYDEVMRKIQQTPPNRPKMTAADSQKEIETIFPAKVEALQRQAAVPEAEESAANKYKIGESSELMFEVQEENQEKESREVETHAAWEDALEPDSHPGSSTPSGNEFSNHEKSIKFEEKPEVSRSLSNLIEEALHEEEETEAYTEEYTEDTALSGRDDLNSNAITEPEDEEVPEKSQLIQDMNIESENEELSNPVQEKSVQEEKPSSRGSIPFNVIMLNNDRKKLNHQGKESNPAEEKKNNIAMFPSESIQQSAASAERIEDYTTSEQKINQEEDDISYYQFPSRTLLTPPVIMDEESDWLYEQEQMLNSTLQNFNVRARVVNVTQGPSVTRFEVQPEPGVKVNKITNLSDDIKLSLAARDIRIEAPIPGKHTIGIEVPNQSSRPVFISEIINTPEFQNGSSPLTAVLGLDISGKPIVTDLRKMPHGLIAGATGSGKSVCINTILVSLLYKASPDELKLLLIDPKMVELAPYNRIPHLVSPVITDVKAATAALKWAVEEMERRYELFAHAGVRDINRFNELAEEHKQYSEKLPFMVIVIDELADLMMMAPADVEEAICRIAQKARACGMHLIIATQRPSVDVITGLIKANVPTRVAFSVSSQIDSRTIIDISGAEKLLGRGDMLFLENGSSKPVRLQGTFVSDKEIDDVVAHVRREQEPDYLFEQEELLKKAQAIEEEDELFFEACEFVVDQGSASTSSLQRRFKIGYNRAARLIDMMEKQGFISENKGSKPRDVLITAVDLESIQDTSTLN
ncbi:MULTISPECIES: DNA translocase FtsK [Cytobacillus]|uniref:DNA translocase FtsK n=1 Tax=Cytobacillus TaxID=2675230 RepID=UPI00203D52FC|nr:DNA translocase FtsK [Cytobacillus firmus]MCM3708646.1 FtsK/SpoIIIE domain-containing protein [Cytobacillus firmus]